MSYSCGNNDCSTQDGAQDVPQLGRVRTGIADEKRSRRTSKVQMAAGKDKGGAQADVELCRLFDVDGSGTLSVRELRHAVRRL